MLVKKLAQNFICASEKNSIFIFRTAKYTFKWKMDILYCPSGGWKQNPTERAGVAAMQTSAGEEKEGGLMARKHMVFHASCSFFHCWRSSLFAQPPYPSTRRTRLKLRSAGSSLEAAGLRQTVTGTRKATWSCLVMTISGKWPTVASHYTPASLSFRHLALKLL